jgi:hypothetical protein
MLPYSLVQKRNACARASACTRLIAPGMWWMVALALLVNFSACATRMKVFPKEYPVATKVGVLQLKSTVDSPEAKYYLEQYRQGERCNANWDAQICKLTRELQHTSLSSAQWECIMDHYSYDLVSSVYGDVIAERTRRIDPTVFDLLEQRMAQFCQKDSEQACVMDEPAAPSADHPKPLIVMVPGAFHKSDPIIHAGMESFMSYTREHGVDVILAMTEELGTVEKNTLFVEHAILEAQATGREFSVVSLSRGAAEVHLALSRLDGKADISGLHTWISISGIPRGSPLADQMAQFPRCIVASIYLKRKDIGELSGVKSMTVSRLKREFPCRTIPSTVRVISVVPILVTGSTTKKIKRRFRYMANMGPNDGVGLCADGMLPGSLAIPMIGQDHGFNFLDTNCMGLSLIHVAEDMHARDRQTLNR